MPQQVHHSTTGDGTNQELPVAIHPDDARDKVFTAILMALSKMGNKPSSPKELANVIIQHEYATLGGATPFATVSSRISQHFKRAAKHNPPRAPLLAKHVDQNHSRKINYSLAKEAVSTHSLTRRISTHDIGQEIKQQTTFPRKRTTAIDIPTSDSEADTQLQKRPRLNTVDPISTLPEDESEGEMSDYHEDMLQGDDNPNTPNTIQIPPAPPSSPLHPWPPKRTNHTGEYDFWAPHSFDHDLDTIFLSNSTTPSSCSDSLDIDTPESTSMSELDTYFHTTKKASRHHTLRSRNNTKNNHHNNHNHNNSSNNNTNNLPLSLPKKVLLANANRSLSGERDPAGLRRKSWPEQSTCEMPWDRPLKEIIDRPWTISQKTLGSLVCDELAFNDNMFSTVLKFRRLTDRQGAKDHGDLACVFLEEGHVNATQLDKLIYQLLHHHVLDISETEKTGVVQITKGPLATRGVW
ncbi:hypothetical protein J3Q64DRAFT_1759642 [Phycomyces blakesleeanus]